MSDNHTPEPWKCVDRGDERCLDIDAITKEYGDVTIVMNVSKDNARRIVACVNACAGIPTDMLEAMPSGPAALLPMYARLEKQRDSFKDAAEYHRSRADEAEKQRDDLLAALEYVHPRLDDITDKRIVEEAIANVKGE